MNEISFKFRVKSSHSQANNQYSGSSRKEITPGNFIENKNFFGIDIKKASISKKEELYQVEIKFAKKISIDDAEICIENISYIITYEMSFDSSHYYGSHFIEIDYEDFYCNNGSGIRDYVKIHSSQIFDPSKINITNVQIPELTRFYFLGMQSNNPKAKFFNLFAIIEFIEASEIMKNMFSKDMLFSEEETKILEEAAKKINCERKTGIIKSISKQTKKSRKEKLSDFLHEIGINKFCLFEKTHCFEITPKITGELIDARNKLFHGSKIFDEQIIYSKLIPITREIIRKFLDPEFNLIH